MAETREKEAPVKTGPSPLRSIIAGSTAGAVEIGTSTAAATPETKSWNNLLTLSQR